MLTLPKGTLLSPPVSQHAPATQIRPPLASSEHSTMHTLPAPNTPFLLLPSFYCAPTTMTCPPSSILTSSDELVF
ncbi:hypothetical protein K503DRAFT_805406 [Rhizopogon vinicolor AM-OR11-026]|uniref:Uncharacterized protein n=1 Tax=Rhizopogon vinicolor AM-OR11-026 TaxID=1314800 RepID=A0A1B7MHY2_9AGAM|nr:hypothetical protein K503DRAFT_805406 [Rhizopogon vinicolor AM-OR11-026]